MDNIVNSLVEGMERLGLIASRIRKNEGKAPQIEIDIILEELRNLYMVALQLEATESVAPAKVVPIPREDVLSAAKAEEERRLAEEAAAKKAAEEKRLAEEAAARKAAEEKRLAEEAAAKKAAEEKRLAEEAAAKKAAEERARKIVDDEFHPTFAPATPEKPTEPIMEPQLERLEGNPNDELFSEQPAGKNQESLLDLFKSETKEEKPKVRTLADTLNRHQRNVEEQLETRVHAKKVDDLRTIININDKFSFMSELFHNNMKAYNDFILQLNAMTSREEALAFVAGVATQYNWDDNSVVVKGFYKIFDRKF